MARSFDFLLSSIVYCILILVLGLHRVSAHEPGTHMPPRRGFLVGVSGLVTYAAKVGLVL